MAWIYGSLQFSSLFPHARPRIPYLGGYGGTNLGCRGSSSVLLPAAWCGSKGPSLKPAFPLQALYMFYALAIVCDDFFVPSLEKICEVRGKNLEPSTKPWATRSACHTADKHQNIRKAGLGQKALWQRRPFHSHLVLHRVSVSDDILS